MKLFQTIAALAAKGVSLVIEVNAAETGKLEVNLIPKSETGKSGFALGAQTFTATPEELDLGFTDVLAAYVTSTGSLQEQLLAYELAAEATKKEAEAANKEAAAKRASAPAKTRPVLGKRPGADPESGMRPESEGETDDGSPDGDDVGATQAAPTTPAAAPVPFLL